MKTEFLMGNEAIALGAMHAGVSFVSGYPGTPSTEILETVAKRNPGDIYVEWSVNEKAALEAAAGAAYAGARTLVTMKQVGLNVASDPLMSLAYVGVKGGMVIVSADDPGPISSQTEQDTRHFAQFAKLPVFDPSTAEEAYEMIQDAYDYSEKYGIPVLFRPVTRVCHSCASVPLREAKGIRPAEGFRKDTSRWVIFPRTSYLNHIKLEENAPKIGQDFSGYRFNQLEGEGTFGIATAGISATYTREVLHHCGKAGKFLKIATANPFPEALALRFLEGLEKVVVIEELDPVIENALIHLCGKYKLHTVMHVNMDCTVQPAGENSVESVAGVLEKFLPVQMPKKPELPTPPPLPVRPPVLCAGCPHRASFYAVKKALKGRKAVFCGDIGCYTLGNAQPLDMTDTCLCMGADVTMAQGMQRIEPDTLHFSFIGDSTFFASGITGVVNAVYNQTDIILVVLDNSTTAMTGHQPHPGTGVTMMGEVSNCISIEKILEAIGVRSIQITDPLDYAAAVAAVQKAAGETGVRAIIFRSPCIAKIKPAAPVCVDTEKGTSCKFCIREIGCPAITLSGGKAQIEPSLCTGCGLCTQICPFHAIDRKEAAK